ncbi:tetratricopeptide repeat protein [Sulfurivermis fontis]|uniref:tetratricopeptide repeat protein n=1 Tax=Sulfurivermis fontis TaxID=1972068 RepID=UPI000FDB05E0|nr:tetratricopeptide repeat protein [Sulfurivermis fontis]
MNKIIAIMLLAVLTTAIASAETPARPAAGETKTQPESRFKGAVFDALRNLSAMLPKQNGRNADPRQSATMGIRGAETTTTLITPYWKDDRSEDPAFQAEVQSYGAAQQLLEEGKLKEAEAAFGSFIQAHGNSDLLPNARFGQALALAALGDGKKSKAAMEAFLKDYPQHPLAADAQKVAAELK